MKELLISTALLLTAHIHLKGMNENPPVVKPETEQIILVPQDIHDIDRVIPNSPYPTG